MLPPSFLYGQVRAVLVVYCTKLDADSKKSLFNKRAWKKANNLLEVLLDGFISNPPDLPLCLHQLNKKGDSKIDSDGFYLYHYIRETNLIELFHKSLVSAYRTWQVGIEYSDCLLMERNRRNNHRMSL